MGSQQRFQWLRWTSLTSQSSRYHLKIAIALVVVIPMLSFSLVGLSLFTTVVIYSPATHGAILLAGFLCGVLGFGMLRQYPTNIERMRDYLEKIAADDLPKSVTLIHSEHDSSDIERYLNEVVQGLHDKINALDEQLEISRKLTDAVRKQSEEIVDAERQRVMIESLGAACHHLGQPATILRIYFSCIKDLRPEVMEQKEFCACSMAIESISEVLQKLQRVSKYRTTPYAAAFSVDENTTSSDNKTQIVDINPPPAPAEAREM